MINKSKGLTYDFFWYFLGMSIPMFVLFLRSPIYTRIFSTEMYGQFALVNVTYTYLGTLTFSWMVNTIARYYNKYKKQNRLRLFFQIQSLFLVLTLLIYLLVGLIWYFISDNELVKKLALFGALHFIFYESLNYLCLPLRLQGKAKLNNIMRIISSVVSFVVLLGLTFLYNLTIEAFYISTIVINFILVLWGIFKGHFTFTLKFAGVTQGHLVRFFKFGGSELVLSIGIVLIMSSDRYLISYFSSFNDVGIYNQVYNLAQLVLVAVITVFQTTTNPYVFKLFEEKRHNTTFLAPYIYIAAYAYLFFTLFVCLFPNEIALLLGEDFRTGAMVIPFVAVGNLFYGITHFLLLRLRYQQQYRVMILTSLTAAVVNILLNLYALPRYGYQAAAVTTLFSYVVLFAGYLYFSKFSLVDIKGYTAALGKLLLSAILIILIAVISSYIIFKGDYLAQTVIKALALLVVYAVVNGYKTLLNSLKQS